MQLERFTFRDLSDGSDRPPARSYASSKPKTELEAPPPPEPTFSEAQLKSAERDGYQKGFLAGIQEGRIQAETEQATIDRALSSAVEQFAQAVAPIFEAHRRLALDIKEQMPQVALSIARKVAGQALAENAAEAVSDIAIRCCETMCDEPKLVIAVHDSVADTLTRKLEETASRLPPSTDIVILRDPGIPHTDCRIEWANGAMERNTQQLWQQLEQVIADMSATARRDASTDSTPTSNTEE